MVNSQSKYMLWILECCTSWMSTRKWINKIECGIVAKGPNSNICQKLYISFFSQEFYKVFLVFRNLWIWFDTVIFLICHGLFSLNHYNVRQDTIRVTFFPKLYVSNYISTGVIFLVKKRNAIYIIGNASRSGSIDRLVLNRKESICSYIMGGIILE